MTKIEAWVHAARPKTLAGAVAPVLVALTAAALHRVDVFDCDDGIAAPLLALPAVLCLLFALLMQIDANLINDYFDFVHGRDDGSRLGPKRACAQGWLTTSEMLRGIVLTSALACMVGFPLVFWGGWALVLVGIACLAGAFLYTTALAQYAMGDVLVVLFFGFVPVCASFYVQTGVCPSDVLMLGLAIGLVTDCLLLVNNFRDYDNDLSHRKRTLVTIIGRPLTKLLYAACGIAAVIIVAAITRQWFVMLVFLLPHFHTLYRLHRIGSGAALNSTLAQTSLNRLFFAVLTIISLILQ